MKTSTPSLIALLSAALTFSAATAQQESGKDTPVVPAIAEGLRLTGLDFMYQAISGFGAVSCGETDELDRPSFEPPCQPQ